jgi:hypothetical protein
MLNLPCYPVAAHGFRRPNRRQPPQCRQEYRSPYPEWQIRFFPERPKARPPQPRTAHFRGGTERNKPNRSQIPAGVPGDRPMPSASPARRGGMAYRLRTQDRSRDMGAPAGQVLRPGTSRCHGPRPPGGMFNFSEDLPVRSSRPARLAARLSAPQRTPAGKFQIEANRELKQGIAPAARRYGSLSESSAWQQTY